MEAEPTIGVTRGELRRLFAGDAVGDLWAPCHSPRLAFALCEAYRPDTLPLLLTAVFGSVPLAELDPAAVEVLEGSFRRWRVREGRGDKLVV